MRDNPKGKLPAAYRNKIISSSVPCHNISDIEATSSLKITLIGIGEILLGSATIEVIATIGTVA